MMMEWIEVFVTIVAFYFIYDHKNKLKEQHYSVLQLRSFNREYKKERTSLDENRVKDKKIHIYHIDKRNI